MEKLKSYFKEVKEIVNNYLAKVLPESLGKIEDILLESMKYSLFAGGKRFRPLLAYLSYGLFDSKKGKVLPYAAALEMIHTYSLIHDDLPSMDNDSLRRGKPTNHIKFGEATALLAGDALLTHAFFVLSDEGIREGLSSEKLIKAVRILSGNAGIYGMVTGQVLDLEQEGKQIDLGDLEKIHKFKTGKLIEAAVLGGAILGGAQEDSPEYRALMRYSNLIGLIFQITDDILDVEGITEELGKEVGSDEKLDKSTYPKIIGLKRSKELLENYVLDARTALDVFADSEEKEILQQIPVYLKERKN